MRREKRDTVFVGGDQMTCCDLNQRLRINRDQKGDVAASEERPMPSAARPTALPANDILS